MTLLSMTFHRRHPALQMLIVCLAIPLAGALLFKTRAPLLTEYHFQLLGRSLATKSWQSATEHAGQLFVNNPQGVERTLYRSLDWPAESRAWLAQFLIESAEDINKAGFIAGEWNGSAANDSLAETELLKLAYRLDSGNLDSLRVAAKIAMNRHHFSYAAWQMRRLIMIAADRGADASADDYDRLGRSLYELDLFREAAAAFKRSSQMKGASTSGSLWMLIQCWRRLGEYRKAIRCATELLVIDPGYTKRLCVKVAVYQN